MKILPDVLERGLKVVFCGLAVGPESERQRAFFAHKANKFWKILHRVNLTPNKLKPEEYQKLPKYGVGLTDLVKNRSGPDSKISPTDTDILRLRSKITKYKPKVLAFNGKRAAKEFLGHHVKYGRQSERIGRTIIFVLPSTSPAAKRYWGESYWRELADLVKRRNSEKIVGSMLSSF